MLTVIIDLIDPTHAKRHKLANPQQCQQAQALRKNPRQRASSTKEPMPDGINYAVVLNPCEIA